MKLQNMTVIFIIIMIPIIFVVSYYIGLQINTITMQKNYTVKLQTAAKDSIQALEINTVEWNSASSNLADSKRRDVLAAINTFTTSLANGMGIGGAGKGRIQTYIPAIVYTMYDGYYIYSASLMKEQETDNNGLTQFEKGTSGKDTGNIKYNTEGTSSYQYILKPYSPYSARYVTPDNKIDVTVNYTLDNYIRVYGTVNGEYQTKEGYLVVCATSNSGADANIGVYINQSGNNISDINDLKKYISTKNENDIVYFKVKSNGKEKTRKAQVIKINDELKVGIAFLTTYEYETVPEIKVKTKASESGSSGGLMLSLAIYNSLIDEDITKGKKVVGTGTIDINGNVGKIDGVKYKILGAVKNKADLFICPKENYDEAIRVKKEHNLDIKIISVETFDEAIESLNNN